MVRIGDAPQSGIWEGVNRKGQAFQTLASEGLGRWRCWSRTVSELRQSRGDLTFLRFYFS